MKNLHIFLGGLMAIPLVTASMYLFSLEVTYMVIAGLVLFLFSFFHLDWAVCALIFLVPFNLQILPLDVRFLNSVPEFLMFLILVAFALQLTLGRITLKKSAVFVPVILFALSLLLSLIRARTIDYVQLYYQFSVILLFFVVISIARDRAAIRRIILSMIVSTFVISVTAVVQFVSKENPQVFSFIFGNQPGSILYSDGFFRSIGSFSQPNALGGFLLIGTPFFLIMRQRARFLPMFFLVLVALFSTLSRSALLGFGAMLALFVFANKSFRSKLTWIASLSIILVLLLALFPVLTNTVHERFSNLLTGGTDSHTIRLVLYGTALRMFESSPLFGVGIGNFITAQDILEVKGAHNIFLNILAELGLVGFVSFLAIQIFILGNNVMFFRKEKEGVLCATIMCCSISIMGFLTAELFDSLMHSFTISLYLWVIYALSLSVTNLNREGTDYESRL